MHKNVTFKNERSQSNKIGQTDRLRILLFKFRHSTTSDADQDDDDVASSANGDFNDTNNNKENEKYILIGKRDFPILFAAANQLTQQLDDAEQLDDDDLFAQQQQQLTNSSLSYGNNLNAIMNMNRNSIKNRSTANSNASSASTTPVSGPSKQLNGHQRFMMHNMMPYAQYANTENINYLVVLIGLICLGILFLPLNVMLTPMASSGDSRLPIYMHVSIEVKLFASFVMGMIAMVILRA